MFFDMFAFLCATTDTNHPQELVDVWWKKLEKKIINKNKNTLREKCKLIIYLSISQGVIYQSPETEAHE